ncbi:MAG: cytidylate kinase-like family protein, partial [Duncaniella sp.]|nr:cytidylate kinase-like family protein [Duncaniella sp.]
MAQRLFRPLPHHHFPTQSTKLKGCQMKNDESMLSPHGQHQPFVITVGRQFGSGGRVLAKALAESLGIAYFYQELLGVAAKHAGV